MLVILRVMLMAATAGNPTGGRMVGPSKWYMLSSGNPSPKKHYIYLHLHRLCPFKKEVFPSDVWLLERNSLDSWYSQGSAPSVLWVVSCATWARKDIRGDDDDDET